MPSPERERARRWIAVLVASLAAHAAVLLTLGTSALRKRGDGSPLNPIDVTFAVVEPPPREPPRSTVAAEPTGPPDATPDTTPTADRRLRRRRRRRSEVSKTPPSVKPSETPPAEVTVSPSPTTPNLDPERAVRAVFLSQESFPGETREAPTAATAAPGEDREAPNYFEGVGKKRYLSEREPPKLRRHGDGTYRYRSHAFKAIVAKDGSVTFEDKNRQGMTVSFDLTDAMMRRRGEDPYRYEKEHFLKSTAAFRQELFERWQEKQTRIALRKLRVRLLRISEDVTLSQQEKAARVLAIFQNTADDEAGAAARETIAEFVSRRMPGVELSKQTP